MTASPRAYGLIRRFEGLRLQSYRDPVGLWTIGYGTTHDAHPGQCITEDQANALLRQEVERIEPVLNAAITVPVTQQQFDACVSLAFNIGLGKFAKSTLLKKLNAGDSAGAAEEFAKWVYADSRKLAGLVTRRAAEAMMFRESASA